MVEQKEFSSHGKTASLGERKLWTEPNSSPLLKYDLVFPLSRNGAAFGRNLKPLNSRPNAE